MLAENTAKIIVIVKMPRTHVATSEMVFDPQNMGLDILFVQLSALLAEI